MLPPEQLAVRYAQRPHQKTRDSPSGYQCSPALASKAAITRILREVASARQIRSRNGLGNDVPLGIDEVCVSTLFPRMATTLMGPSGRRGNGSAVGMGVPEKRDIQAVGRIQGNYRTRFKDDMGKLCSRPDIDRDREPKLFCQNGFACALQSLHGDGAIFKHYIAGLEMSGYSAKTSP